MSFSLQGKSIFTLANLQRRQHQADRSRPKKNQRSSMVAAQLVEASLLKAASQP